MMEKLTDLYSDAYFRFKKAIFLFVGAIVLGVLVFAYLANVQIDGGTEQTYRTLDVLFYIFCGLLPVAAAAVGFFLYVHAKRQKIWLSRFRKSKLNRRIRTFDVVLAVVIGIFCVLCIYPIIYVLAGSFNQGADYSIGGVWFLPRVFTFENYAVVLQDGDFWMSYGITIARTLLGTATALIYTAIVAYAMSRPNLKFRRVFYWINIFTMFFSGGLVPYFLIIKSIGLYDTFWVYIIPGLYSVYNMIIIQNFFKGLPEELREAAIIDGASELKIWWTIYMPLSKPVLATVALWLATGFWNSYFSTMVYTRAGDLETLQYFLMKMIKEARVDTGGMDPSLIEQTTSATISFAAIVIATIPILLVYPFIQKYFAKGIMIGSLKG